MNFDLPVFIKRMEKAEGIGEDQVKFHVRTLTTMRLILDNTHITPELLNQVSTQDIEWAFDLMSYWPTWEGEMEAEDFNHAGVQHVQIRYLVNELSAKKSEKRRATFI